MVSGLEADSTSLPEWSDGLTIAGAVSFLNSEITRRITPTDDVRRGDERAFAPDSQGWLDPLKDALGEGVRRRFGI